MERTIKIDFLKWKDRPGRKPLLLRGARQVGKTYALKTFGKDAYERVHYLNFEESPALAKIFDKDFNPSRILQEIAFALDSPPPVPGKDLLILDEIQQAPKALTSLKYFAEDMSALSVCGAGSLLGLHLGGSGFPVGKVEFLDLHPMSFEEFLSGIGEDKALPYVQEAPTGPLPEVVHGKLWDLLKAYFVVGGLPEAVAAYAALKHDPFRAFESVRKIQGDLLTAYLADVAKHAGKVNAMHIERVWRSVPSQLARSLDGSAAKFVFKGVVPGVNGYARLSGAVDWLEAAGLILKVPIVKAARQPLSAFVEENFFKLYMFDVGLLGALGGLPPRALWGFDFGSYKGYVAENFALQELVAAGRRDAVCWREGTAEVEFLLEQGGAVLPVEIKSGWVTQAKSLKVFAHKYHPPFRTILSARNVSLDPAHGVHHLPLYLASRIHRLSA